VEETILYSEVRKILRARTDKTYPNISPEVHGKQPRQTIIRAEKPDELTNEEIELLRILIKYGKLPLFEQDAESSDNPEIISVAGFIISQLLEEDLVSDKPIFKTFISELEENADNPDFYPDRYFIHHPDKNVAQMASDLLAEKLIESKRWNKAGAYTEKESEVLDWLVPRIVNEFKLRKIKEMHMVLENQVDVFHKLNDENQLFEVLAKIQNLKKIEKFLSDKLGNRTIN